MATPAIDAVELPTVEREIEVLAEALDGRVEVTDQLGMYAVALGRRGVTLWNGVRTLASVQNTAGAAATLRPELEALILIGWLAADPEDRLVRWHGESERSVRTMVTRSTDDPIPDRHERLTSKLSAERMAARESAISDAKAKVAGGTRLMPSVEKMAEEANGGPTFWEAYQRAYRYLSAWEHHDHGTFDESLEGDDVIVEDARFDPFEVRILAASVTAALLIVVGSVVGMPDLVSGAKSIRERLLVSPTSTEPAGPTQSEAES